MALLILISTYFALALTQQISGDHNCTRYTPNGFVYTWQAVACNDVKTESYCKEYYNNYVYPAEGGGWNRAQACYSKSPAIPSWQSDEYAKIWALASCPKTCGYCCQTQDFGCQNKNDIACATVTQAQCKDPAWREFLADQCPSTCGYCFYKDCWDLIPDCQNDPGICTEATLQSFVNWYCRGTCNKCGRPGTTSTTRGPSTKEFTRPLTVF